MEEVRISVFVHDSLKEIMPKQIYEKLLVEGEKEERDKAKHEKNASDIIRMMGMEGKVKKVSPGRSDLK